jgi:serine/threonine-protein kinase
LPAIDDLPRLTPGDPHTGGTTGSGVVGSPGLRVSPWLLVALGTLVAASLGLCFGLLFRKPASPPAAASAVAPKTLAQPVASTAPALAAPAPTAAEKPPPPAPSAEASVQASTARERVRAKPPVRPAKTRTKACDPPYTIDANGRRRYKAECF